ncbi:unnamed protein product [Allacma fusca]|uniref:Uncharacterized protein n=1 Tax=Allacma fusca TaxID=39272 RepID=A0A8J2LLI8_9HEXA|nr:unnamed protein product [Allacma fusca]
MTPSVPKIRFTIPWMQINADIFVFIWLVLRQHHTPLVTSKVNSLSRISTRYVMPNYQKLLGFPVNVTIITLLMCSFLAGSCSCAKLEYEGNHQIEPNAAAIFQHKLRSKRHVADGMLDPYSVLGFLSFATFVFSVLYNNKMKPAKPNGGGGAGPSGPPMLNSVTKLTDYTKLASLLRKVIKNSKQQVPMKEEVLEEYLDYDDSFEGDGIDQKHEDTQQST